MHASRLIDRLTHTYHTNGSFDLCILLMFSPFVLELTEEAHRFLFTVAQVRVCLCVGARNAMYAHARCPSKGRTRDHEEQQHPSCPYTHPHSL